VTLSREVPIDAGHAALLFVDVQNYNARPDGGEYTGMTSEQAGIAISEWPQTESTSGGLCMVNSGPNQRG